jgi:hypothetical protein
MKVYLVPAGPSRYALYSEAATPTAEAAGQEPRSFWGRISASFRRAVDEGEAEAAGKRATADPAEPAPGRLRRFITRKLAEAVAEQRLLWAIRHEARATLVHPDRLTGSQAIELARAEFATDFARHRRWAVIDAVLVAITGPVFFFVPGPNVVSWYFTFRAVGHYFSMKGARCGLAEQFFSSEPSAALSDVGDALECDADTRDGRVEDAATALGLEKLAAFVRRVADRSA